MCLNAGESKEPGHHVGSSQVSEMLCACVCVQAHMMSANF